MCSLFKKEILENIIKEKEISNKMSQGKLSYMKTMWKWLVDHQWEEIEEEILSLRDRDELQIKAERFKPRLDQMQEQVLEQKIQQQELARKKQEEQSRMYQESVYQTHNFLNRSSPLVFLMCQ